MKGTQVLLLIVGVMIGLALSSDVRVGMEHTTTLSVPQGWTQVKRAEANHITRVTIAVTHTNTDQLEAAFWEVSNPQSPRYAKYMTLEEVNAFVAPTQASKDTVTQWLLSNGIVNHEFTPSGDFIIAYGTVHQFEQLLGTEYHVYKHSTTGQELVRALSPYTVPLSVASHLDFVGGLTHFPKTRANKAKSTAPLADVTPSVIKQFFNIPSTLVGTAANNSQAVAQFLDQYYAPTDLASFQKKYGLTDQPVTKVVGPNVANNPGIEASLDIEYIMAIAPQVPTWFVYTSGLYQGQEPFLDWIVNMSSTPNAPYVHSVSYGDDESSISYAYALRVDEEFMKYGLVSRSILFASGDDGVGCKGCRKFQPNWPASSAYVTAVGGIYLNGNTPVGDSIASGGFSNIFAQPSYQTSVVKAYLAAHSTPEPSFYNASGRAIPDIASFSEDLVIAYSGAFTGVGGTSCAAPVISGVISLLNDARLNNKKPPLGFLNPFLYQTLASNPDAFIDVTTGSNPNGCCLHGFSAATGWDPITGVGVPNFPNLLKYALAV